MRARSIAVVFLAGIAWVAYAAQGPAGADAPKIAVLDLAGVFDKYQMTKVLEEKFDAKRRGLAEEADRRRGEIDVKEQALSSFKPDTKDYKDRSEELTKRRVEYQVWVGTQEQLLKDWHKQWLLKIYIDVQNAAAKIAADRGIELVLIREEASLDAPDSNTLRQRLLLQKVIHFDPRLDITEVVLATANDEFQKRGGADNVKVGAADGEGDWNPAVGQRLADARR